MEIDVKCSPGEPFVLRVNGQLVADVAAGVADSRDDLLARVEHARRLEALPKIVHGICNDFRKARDRADEGRTPDQKAAGFSAGFSDGLDGTLIPHPSSDVPGFLPGVGSSYDRGYSAGNCLRRLLAALDAQEAPR